MRNSMEKRRRLNQMEQNLTNGFFNEFSAGGHHRAQLAILPVSPKVSPLSSVVINAHQAQRPLGIRVKGHRKDPGPVVGCRVTNKVSVAKKERDDHGRDSYHRLRAKSHGLDKKNGKEKIREGEGEGEGKGSWKGNSRRKRVTELLFSLAITVSRRDGEKEREEKKKAEEEKRGSENGVFLFATGKNTSALDEAQVTEEHGRHRGNGTHNVLDDVKLEGLQLAPEGGDLGVDLVAGGLHLGLLLL